jgi:LPS-assembly protein
MNILGAMLKSVKAIVLLLIVLAPMPEDAYGTTTADENPASAEELSNKVRFKADEMDYDRDLDITTARGNVQFANQDRLLQADVIVYNRKQDFVTASGNITLLEPTGEVLFAEFMELSGNLRDGVVADLRAILQDGSLVAASGGRRTGGNLLDMRNAVYSPCKLCEEDPARAPLWQIKAVRVVHDKKRQTIEYTDAWLEVAGIPVMYTPYISHPDPSVKRKSGFLTPSFGSSTSTGTFVTTPYYYNISSNSDATLTPTLTADESIILGGEYRKKAKDGDFEARASIKQNSPADERTPPTEHGGSGIRGHISAKGRFDYDQTWRWGFDVNRQSDETYMSRFGLNQDNTLPKITNALASKAYIEGFHDRNYIHAEALSFQTTLTGQKGTTIPVIFPLVDINYVSEPDAYGASTTLDLNFLTLSRQKGTDTRRISARRGWNRP